VKDLIGKRAESSKNPPVKTGGFVYKRQAKKPGFVINLRRLAAPLAFTALN
jgi:hypothetical protein